MSRRDALAARRKAMGYTQETLAFELDVDVTTVARWERGVVSPLPAQRPALAAALSVSLERLDVLLSDARAAEEVTSAAALAAPGDHWGGELVRPVAVGSTASESSWAAHVDGALRLEAAPGRFFGGEAVDVRVLPAMEDDGRIIVTPPVGSQSDPFFTRPGRGLVFGVVGGEERPYGLDVRRVRRRLMKSPPGAPLVVPPAFELDDLTAGILWAVLSLDAALLSDDALLARHRRVLSDFEAQPRSVVRSDAADDVYPVSQMWLGSSFCARHILRHIEGLATDPPVFWTQEQRGEEASAWLLFAHKHAYLQALARRFAGSPVSRVFCVPSDVVAASPAPERVLFFLAAALMESFGIEVVVSAAPEYAGMDGFVLDRDRRAIVATWIGTDGLCQVDVTGARPTVRDFADASGHARARSVIAQPTPGGRLRALADYLDLDWPWLVGRCAALGDYGCSGLAEPRSRLLSAAGVDRACRFVGDLAVVA